MSGRAKIIEMHKIINDERTIIAGLRAENACLQKELIESLSERQGLTDELVEAQAENTREAAEAAKEKK